MRNVLLCLLVSFSFLMPAGLARAADLSDNFNGGTLDTTKWAAGTDPGTTVAQTGGELVMTVNPTTVGSDIGALIHSTYMLRGPFDIQTDYQLTQWPAQNDATVALSADPYPDDFNALERISGQASVWGGTGEVYLTQFMPRSGGGVGGVTLTADMAGKLRLVRDANDVLSGYYWDASTQQWVLVHSQPVSGADVMVVLHCWGSVLSPIEIAFDNFQVNSGEVAVPGTFRDVPADYWAYSEIYAVTKAGLVTGYSDETYRPTDSVTRDQMAVYIARAIAGGDAEVPTGPSVATFTDVPTNYWAYKYIAYAKALGIVTGYSSTTYAPAVPVDRGQMAVFIARAIASPTGDGGLAGYTPPTTPDFPDVPTSFWAYKYIEYIKGKGITGGYPDGLYHPELVVTRDQMAVYITRAFKLQ